MPKDAKGHGSNPKGNSPTDDKVFYHGSPDQNIKSFDPSKTSRGVYGRGVYVTRRQDLAQQYAGPGGRVYPVHIDRSRTLDLTTPAGQAEFKSSSESQLRKKYDVVRAPGQSVVLNAKAIRHAPQGKK